MDQEAIRKALVNMLASVATKARQDALNEESDIAAIYNKDRADLQSLDIQKVEEAIRNIDRATATKEGARRLVNAIMVAAKAILKAKFPT